MGLEYYLLSGSKEHPRFSQIRDLEEYAQTYQNISNKLALFVFLRGNHGLRSGRVGWYKDGIAREQAEELINKAVIPDTLDAKVQQSLQPQAIRTLKTTTPIDLAYRG